MHIQTKQSQKRRYTWETFHDMLKVYQLARPRIYISIYEGYGAQSVLDTAGCGKATRPNLCRDTSHRGRIYFSGAKPVFDMGSLLIKSSPHREDCLLVTDGVHICIDCLFPDYPMNLSFTQPLLSSRFEYTQT